MGYSCTWSHFIKHLVGRLWTRIGPSQNPLPDKTQYSVEADIHAIGVIRNRIANQRQVANPRRRPSGHRYQRLNPWITGWLQNVPMLEQFLVVYKTISYCSLKSRYTELSLISQYIVWFGILYFFFLNLTGTVCTRVSSICPRARFVQNRLEMLPVFRMGVQGPLCPDNRTAV